MVVSLKLNEPKKLVGAKENDIRFYKFDGEVIESEGNLSIPYRIDVYEYGRTVTLRRFKMKITSIRLGFSNDWQMMNKKESTLICPFARVLKLSKHTSKVEFVLIAEKQKIDRTAIETIMDTKTFHFETPTSATRREGIL